MKCQIYISVRCNDFDSVTAATRHDLPFIPSRNSRVKIFLPKIPEGFEPGDWSGRVENVCIERDGEVWLQLDTSRVEFDLDSEKVIRLLKKAGWTLLTVDSPGFSRTIRQ